MSNANNNTSIPLNPTPEKRTTWSAFRLVLFIAIAVVVIDQIIKIWIKTTFTLGEDHEIFSWFHLTFVENNGMAFGWHLGSKLFLTLFRIIFVAGIIWYILKLRKIEGLKRGYIVCVGLVLAGAVGNIIDCVFYGVVFGDAALLHGRVVDMFYFPLFSFDWPEWIPFIGGTHFEFFKPVFNFADAAISVGVLAILFFYSKQLGMSFDKIKELRKSKVAIDNTTDNTPHNSQKK